nr:peptidyl-tRNA hydrolase 2, mitochondrial-like [Ipomoea batatas]
MGKGKIAAQCSHATLGLYKKLYNRAPKALAGDFLSECHFKVKVVVKIESEDDMLVLQGKRTSTGKPTCIHEETWRIWEAYWDRPDVKAKSKQQRKNRMSEVAGPDREGYLAHSIDRVTTERFIKCFEDVGLMKYLAHDYKMVYLLNATELFANARLERDEIHWRVNETDAVIVHGDIRALFDFPVCEGERPDCPGHAYNQEAL